MKRLLLSCFILGVVAAGAVGTNYVLSSMENPNIINLAAAKASSQETVSHPSAAKDANYASRLDELGLSLHAQIDSTQEFDSNSEELSHCKALVYRTLKSLPSEPVSKLKNLTLVFSESARRGLGGGSTIYLRCVNVSDEELVSVLVHEMGHIMDTGVLSGDASAGESSFKDGPNPVYKNDLSLPFYKVSFDSENKLQEQAQRKDFVSGYAMSDPFEDFAETYAYYVLHGDEFKKMAKNNSKLTRKYYYMKYFVFGGKEFSNGNLLNLRMVNYDVTVLDYDLSRFLAV